MEKILLKIKCSHGGLLVLVHHQLILLNIFLKDEKNSTLFLIEVVNGKKVSGYTQFENEDEIILRIGTEFRVKANPLKQANGSHIVHLIEIDDNRQSLATAMKSLDVTTKSSSKLM